MAGTSVDAPALRVNAVRIGEAGDGADAVHLGRCLTDLRAAMIGSRASLAAGLARTAWIDHLQAWTEAAWAQRDALASSADAYSSTDASASALLTPHPVATSASS